MNIKTFFKDIDHNRVLIFIYAIITLITVFYHETLDDEVLAWNTACGDISGLFDDIRYQGHLYLWYIILQPFIKTGFTLFSMQIIAWVFMLSAAAFFMLKSPFNLFFKTIFIFNAGMIYYYPVIARNYSLIPLFLFLLAYLYPKRHNIPLIYSLLIILLFQTHAYIGGFCFILSLLFIFEVLYILIYRKPFNNGIKDLIGG